MASVSKTRKPISERISMFESPSGSPSIAAVSSTKTVSTTTKSNLIKTLSKTSIGALKSQFDSGGSTSSSRQETTKVFETKSVISSSSSSQSQQSSATSSLASTPAPTPTPPPQNPASNTKAESGSSSGRESANSNKERRKLPATPKPSSSSDNTNPSNKPVLKGTGSGGRSDVVASSKQASAGASKTKTPVSRTPVSASKSTHREHTPLHKKSSPSSGTSSSSPFGATVKQRSPTAPIPLAHAIKKGNHGGHSTEKVNENSSSNVVDRQLQHGGATSNITANKNKKLSSPPNNQGATSINRVKAPVTKTLSSPLTPPKFAQTNNVHINVGGDTTNNNVGNDAPSEEQYERLHSTTIQTTTSTMKTNREISVTNMQNIEVNKVNNSNSFLRENIEYSMNQVLGGQNDNRKNSGDNNINGEKLMSSSESSSSTSPPSASPPPPPIISPMIVPTVTITHEPSNLNNKKSQLNSGDDEVDTTVANNNFKNIVSMQTAAMNSSSTVTGGRNQQYWTNQALQNDNSQTISEAMKLDLDFKDEKIGALNKEIEELQEGGGASVEEVSTLKRQKHDLEMRLKDQEEELDDLAGQVQMLEQAKTKLEMSMAAQKKEHRREVSSKDDELEDARTSTQKKVKVLEQQLESEHEERINFMREKHELETKIINLQELANRSADEEQVAKLKKDLKRTKALLKDAQMMIEKSRNESSNKVVLRQLKNQLEDTEFARMAAVKAKQNVELEVADLQIQLDDVCRNKNDLEDKMLRINREKTDMSSQLEDNEEEMAEVMKKYKASVAQLSVDQITIQQQASSVSDLEEERNKLKEQLAEMSQKIESLEGDNVSTAQHQRLELKIKELETKLELEQTTRTRMETQINRLKEAIEKLNHECDSLRVKEATSQDQARRLQRQLRDLKENYTTLQQKETEVNAKKNEFEKKLELAEAETVTARNDLKLALKRVEDLQQAINGELDSDLDSNSDADSESSDELVGGSFMDHHRRAISVQRERESIARDISARESIQREVRQSIARESVARQLQTMPEEPELKMSENLSHRRINEGDSDLSSDEEVDDKNIKQGREDAVQNSSLDGTTEESHA